jgi:hypothetical protein
MISATSGLYKYRNRKYKVKIKMEKTTKGKGRLLDDDCCTLTENVFQMRLQLSEVRPNTYRLPQSETEWNFVP